MQWIKNFIRGRNISNQLMIVGKAQNLTPLEVKTVITRVGQDTKIVLPAICYKSNNLYVDSLSSGLSAVIEKFKEESIAAYVLLTAGAWPGNISGKSCQSALKLCAGSL